MFSENLKTLRKQKGFSQEELAARLHVVRQTVSKWEKGQSVPDAGTLIRLAEVLEVSVSEQLAIKNRRARRIWKAIGIILAVIVLMNIIGIVLFDVFQTSGGNIDIPEVSEQLIEKASFHSSWL